jgi:hypothetical protein
MPENDRTLKSIRQPASYLARVVGIVIEAHSPQPRAIRECAAGASSQIDREAREPTLGEESEIGFVHPRRGEKSVNEENGRICATLWPRLRRVDRQTSNRDGVEHSMKLIRDPSGALSE